MLHSLNLETNEILVEKTSELDLDVQNFERSNQSECFGSQTFKLERAGHQINGHSKGFKRPDTQIHLTPYLIQISVYCFVFLSKRQ